MRLSSFKRIARLEERTGIGPNLPPPIIMLHSNCVFHDRRKWTPEPDENERDFHFRIVSDLFEAGYPSPIFISFAQKPTLPPAMT
jgi:hypothetical protein